MTSRLATKDKLKDRGRIDQWGFLIFAIGGFLAIVTGKALGASTVVVAVGAVVVMFAYAALIATAGTARVRSDQAGDNCYYLGLIFTLASLSYAIFTFDPRDPATTIVQGFGIALATTIFGLILRVFFNQGRPDLENVEEQLRLELTNAVQRFKGDLGESVRLLNDFSRQVQQSMSELEASTTETIAKFTTNTVSELQEVVAEASTTIRDEANDFAGRSKRYAASFATLIDGLEQHGVTMDRMAAAQEALLETAKAAESAANSVRSSHVALEEGTSSATRAIASSLESQKAAKDVLSGLVESVQKLEAMFASVQDESRLRAEELRGGPSKAVAGAVDDLATAAELLRKVMADASSLHSTTCSGLAAQSEAALETTRRFNGQLEVELDRSRALVAKVHSALTEMTGRLADSVERSI